MELNLFPVLIYNVIDISMISFFGMRLVIKAFENLKLENDMKSSEEEYRAYGSFDVFMENLNYLRRKFWISFFMLEFALIAYFIFWGILFYYQARIIY